MLAWRATVALASLYLAYRAQRQLRLWAHQQAALRAADSVLEWSRA